MRGRGRGRGGIALLVVLLLLLTAQPLPAQVPPDAAWLTFDTEHFRVTYAAGLEPTARRAGDRAERAYALLAANLVEPPSGRIDLVIANNVDYANGYATPFPSNRIVVYAHPPVSEASLSFYDDWLQLILLHELTHVFHLDHAEGIWEPLRSVFGRNPALFPQIFTPGWVAEGLATYLESRLTRAGRVRGTMQEMTLRAAILEDAFFSIDRATGDPVRWPGASTRYIYGSLFLDHLARTRGPESVSEFVEEVGDDLVPYFVEGAARDAFGVSFTRAWRAWEDGLRARYAALADSLREEGLTRPEVLTDAGFYAFFPRYAPDGGALAYAFATGRDEPALRLLLPAGGQRTVTDLNTVGPATWLPDGSGLLLSQLDYRDPFRIHADLYRAGLDGSGERLTEGARLWEVDLHPGGGRVVGVTDADGTNALVVRDLETGGVRRLAEPSLDVHWALPRWSPDGTRIAVGRWTRTGYDVVVLDTAGRVVREPTSDRAVDSAPTWSSDGRYVLFSSDRTGIPNLFAYDLEAGRLHQVTSVLTGAFEPDVSPDGRWIAFSYYRSDGYHIARIPFDPGAWRPAPPVRPAVAAAPLDPALYEATAGGATRPYSPWPSLAPKAWTLLLGGDETLGVGLGGAVAGTDLVGRHLYAAQALVHPDRGRVEGGLAYRFQGWVNPALDLSASQGWSVEAEAGVLRREDGRAIPTALLERERELGAALSWRWPRWQSTSWLTLGGELTDLDRVWDDPGAAADLRLRQFPLDAGGVGEVGYSSVRGFSFSIGPQQGFSASARLEGHRYLEALEGEADPSGYLRLTGRGRGYRGFDAWGFAPHVLALRVDGGVEGGALSPLFRVGGASGGGSPLGFGLDLFGGGIAFPVRGYDEGVQRGTHAVTASAEYRFPLLLVERGFRLLPVFLDRVWGDVFADVGTAWCPSDCEPGLVRALPDPHPLYSAGAELLTRFELGYRLDLTVRAGVAVPLGEVELLDGAAYRPGAKVYVRFGRSF